VSRVGAIVTGACLVGLFAGCASEKTGTVTGKVILDGKPVTGGSVSFLTKSGGIPVTAFIEADGSYRVERVPVGEVLIGVLSPPPDSAAPGEAIKKTGGATGGAERAPDNTKGSPPNPTAAPVADKLLIPVRYNDPGTSGLTTNVKEGENSYDITLTK
jgi:hypothetical protein